MVGKWQIKICEGDVFNGLSVFAAFYFCFLKFVDLNFTSCPHRIMQIKHINAILCVHLDTHDTLRICLKYLVDLNNIFTRQENQIETQFFT